jgi:hypothetical protein
VFATICIKVGYHAIAKVKTSVTMPDTTTMLRVKEEIGAFNHRPKMSQSKGLVGKGMDIESQLFAHRFPIRLFFDPI